MAIKYVPTHFGLMVEYPKPADCDMVVVCVDLSQHTPVTLCLPHQVYREKLRELLAKYPNARSITLMPYRNRDKIEVSIREIEGG